MPADREWYSTIVCTPTHHHTNGYHEVHNAGGEIANGTAERRNQRTRNGGGTAAVLVGDGTRDRTCTQMYSHKQTLPPPYRCPE
jgi:hypothetical protein